MGLELRASTLFVPVSGDMILLGMKKRGFGTGKWNGFGGKVEKGESIREAALRELREEAGVDAADCRQIGELIFTFDAGVGPNFNVTVFTGLPVGEPVETEEMRPQWFHVESIPYNKMWADDEYWLPLLLAGSPFRGRFHYSSLSDIAFHTLEVVPSMLDPERAVAHRHPARDHESGPSPQHERGTLETSTRRKP